MYQGVGGYIWGEIDWGVNRYLVSNLERVEYAHCQEYSKEEKYDFLDNCKWNKKYDFLDSWKWNRNQGLPIPSKLTNWRSKQLSLVGRITLSKSLLKAIPSYYMMTNMILKSSFKEIHKTQEKFYLGWCCWWKILAYS